MKVFMRCDGVDVKICYGDGGATLDWTRRELHKQKEAEEEDPISSQDITIDDVKPDVGILKTEPDEFPDDWDETYFSDEPSIKKETSQDVQPESENFDNKTVENIQTTDSPTEENLPLIHDSEMPSIIINTDDGQNTNESGCITNENTFEGEFMECISTYKMGRKNSYEDITILCTQCNKVLSVDETLYIKKHPNKCKNCLAPLKFGCKMCRYMFNTLRTIQNHMKFYCGKEPRFICLQCNYKTYWRCDLKKHNCKVRAGSPLQLMEILNYNIKGEYPDNLRTRRKNSNNDEDSKTTGLNEQRKQLNANKEFLIDCQIASENTSIEPQTRYRMCTRSSLQSIKCEKNEGEQQTVRNNNDKETKTKNKQSNIWKCKSVAEK